MLFLVTAAHAAQNSVPFADVPLGEALDASNTTVIVEASHVGEQLLGIVPMEHALILAGILFVIGLCGVMVRRNLLFMLMSLEIMMNAAALAFVVAGSRWLNPDGQIMFIFVLTLAAAEAAIGLAILLQFYHRRRHLDVDTANDLRG